MRVRVVIPELPDGVTVMVGPLIELPFFVSDWHLRVLEGAAGEEWNERRREMRKTKDGWPVTLVESEVVCGGCVVKTRLHAFYRFLHHAAVIAVSAPAVCGIDSAIVEVLLEAAPDWARDLALGPHEIWEGFDTGKEGSWPIG